jgi:hypothetical protein
MDPAEILTRPAPPPDATIRYGPGPDNIADVRLPSGGGPRGAARAHSAGDDALMEELPGCGHFEVIDPRSAAWPTVLAAIHALAVG